jgi:hypothetical protein
VKTEQSRRAKSTDQMFAQFLPFIPNWKVLKMC